MTSTRNTIAEQTFALQEWPISIGFTGNPGQGTPENPAVDELDPQKMAKKQQSFWEIR
jgi:hypothetical protein